MILSIIKAGGFFKLFLVLIISGVKFVFAPPFALYDARYNFIETFLSTTIGGLLGVIFFFYLSEIILDLFKKVWPVIRSYFFRHDVTPVHETKKIVSDASRKKQFSRKNKFIVNTRRKYGLWGIAILTPILLSIPLGTFLASKYFKNKKSILLSLAISVVCWSLIMTSFYTIFGIKHH